MSYRLTLFFVLILQLAACHTLKINNSDSVGSTRQQEYTEWNHTGIFGLVNYTDDFHIERMCPGHKWQFVVLERGTMAAVAEGAMSLGSVLNYPLANLASFFWDPLTISWSCSSKRRSRKKDRPEPVYTSVSGQQSRITYLGAPLWRNEL